VAVGLGLGFDAVLLLVVGDCAADRILRKDGTVDLDRRKTELLDDLRVLDVECIIDGATLDPLGGERTRGDGRTTPEALELGILDDAVVTALLMTGSTDVQPVCSSPIVKIRNRIRISSSQRRLCVN
jgi:hypothetical protein